MCFRDLGLSLSHYLFLMACKLRTVSILIFLNDWKNPKKNICLIGKLHEIQISVFKNNVLLEQSHPHLLIFVCGCLCAPPAELRGCRDHLMWKSWKYISWSFIGNLCCPKCGLWTSSIGWPGRLLGTWNPVSTPDPLTQNLRIPGDSCSQYSQRSAGLEALLSPLWLHPPQMQAAREDKGAWLPGAPSPSRSCSEHLDPRTPAPSASAGLLLRPMSPAR